MINPEFKAKRLDNNKWINGLLVFNCANKLCIQEKIEKNVEIYEIDTETLSQFTGFTDKDRKKIFADSDILDNTKYSDDDSQPYVIKFQDGSYRVEYLSSPGILLSPITQRNIDLTKDKIIGNVHEKENNNV